MKNGFFLTLEGPDGAGKSSQITLLAQKAREWGIETVITREPGGTAVGDAIRGVLLNPSYQEMVSLTEVFLYAASRAQLVHEVIMPALEAGKLVICDRFLDSSLAYQVYGGGMDFDFVWRTNLEAVKGRLPDKTFILDINPAAGLARRGLAFADRMEQKPLVFHERVREGFLTVATRFPERITVLNGTCPLHEVFNQIWENVSPAIAKLR